MNIDYSADAATLAFLEPKPLVLDSFSVNMGVNNSIDLGNFYENVSHGSTLIIQASVIFIPIIIALVALLIGDFKIVGTASPGRLFTLFVSGMMYMAAIMWGISQPDGIQAKDDDELSSALASAVSDEELSNEVIKAFESHGWGTDCTNSRDSIICGGTNLTTPAPAYNNDGREAAVNFAIDTEKLRSENNIHLEDKKSRTFSPGEKIELHVDVQKAK